MKGTALYMIDVQTRTFRTLDILTVEDLFIKDGFVLRMSDKTFFSDRTYGTFFREEIGVNIDDPKWSQEGTSKGKRLRYFLRNIDPDTAIKTLKALWKYREFFRSRESINEEVENAHGRLLEVLARLGDTPEPAKAAPSDKPTYAHVKYGVIHDALMSLTELPPQQRGYQFEKFLKKLFNAFGLEAQNPFKLVGEQIDGSFLLGQDTYLLEAKWHNDRTGAADLNVFHGKLEQRAAWSRGLFVSYSGFTEQGLVAFGRGKKLICMDGFDLSEALRRQIPLPEVLHRKARKAVEYGLVHSRVSDLFP